MVRNYYHSLTEQMPGGAVQEIANWNEKLCTLNR